MRDPKCDGVSNHRVSFTFVRADGDIPNDVMGSDSTTNTAPRSKSLICKEKIISTFFAFPYKSMTYKTLFLDFCFKMLIIPHDDEKEREYVD